MRNWFLDAPNRINGYWIRESNAMVVCIGEDWSKVRSPARARRRRLKHRQNIKPIYRPSEEFIVDERLMEIHCHPVMAAKLIAAAVKVRP